MERDPITLLDWRRRVFALYERVRTVRDGRAAWDFWREERDQMFRAHPQTPLNSEAALAFEALDYCPYDPGARVLGEIVPAEPQTYDIAASNDGSYSFTRFGEARFELFGSRQRLELYWLEGYGGGLFLPFRDGTSGQETYGAGRYLMDTVKGADLGMDGDHLILDFNFAYNPSCAYDPRWVCPLAPPPNRLSIRIEAGEKAFAKTRS